MQPYWDSVGSCTQIPAISVLYLKSKYNPTQHAATKNRCDHNAIAAECNALNLPALQHQCVHRSHRQQSNDISTPTHTGR